MAGNRGLKILLVTYNIRHVLVARKLISLFKP